MTISKNEDYKSPLTETLQTTILGNMIGKLKKKREKKEKNPPLMFIEHFHVYKPFVEPHVV